MPKIPSRPRDIVVAIDDGANEAIYVDGALVDWDSTMYMVSLVAAAKGQPCVLRMMSVVMSHGASWPQKLEDLVSGVHEWEMFPPD